MGTSISKIWAGLNWLLARLSGLVVLLMMLTVCYEVVVRYFFRSPTSWSVDLNRYLLVYLVFLMAGVIQGENGHVQVEALKARLSPRGGAALSLLDAAVSLLSMIVLGWLSWGTAWQALRVGARFPDMNLTPKFPVLVVIPFGLLMVSLHLLIQIAALLRRLFRKDAGPSPEELPGRGLEDIVA